MLLGRADVGKITPLPEIIWICKMKYLNIMVSSTLVLVLAVAAFGNDKSRGNISIGSSTTCKAFLDDKAVNLNVYEAYVNGFISGYGLENSGKAPDGSPTLGENNISRAMPVLEKLCKEDTSGNFIKTLLRVCKDILLY